MNKEDLFFKWCKDIAEIDMLVSFFIRNVSTSYISHGEIQDGRAISTKDWNPDLTNVLRQDFNEGCSQLPPPATGLHIATASNGHQIVGLTLIEIVRTTRTSYIQLHDFLVDKDVRGKGIGKQFMAFLQAQFNDFGVHRIFLESGVNNEKAHNFFADQGFNVCSITMTKQLD